MSTSSTPDGVANPIPLPASATSTASFSSTGEMEAIDVGLRLTLDDMFAYFLPILEWAWLSGEEHGKRWLDPAKYVSHVAPDIVGYFNPVHGHRIQVFGPSEYRYFMTLSHHDQQVKFEELFQQNPPCLLLTDGVELPNYLLLMCEASQVPVFVTKRRAAVAIEVIRSNMGKMIADRTSLHGVFMDVLGLGVLITGDSGLGKSELGLELISRGHGLVADDVVDFVRVGPTTLEGRCPLLLKNLLEVRGLGLLDIKAIFGETAVRPKMNLKLVVHLLGPQPGHARYERLPLDNETTDIIGVAVRKVVMPVTAGRNLAVLVEAAVRNSILLLRGINTIATFMENQRLSMDDQT